VKVAKEGRQHDLVPVARLAMFQMMGAFAECECALIKGRVRAGLKRASATGGVRAPASGVDADEVV
jgi:DNA invertase Pin-like site-specific DNA recombinase